MNDFFGQDVVNVKTSAKGQLKARSSSKNKKNRWKREITDPLKKRIFTKQDIKLDSKESQENPPSLESPHGPKEQVSLFDIVSLNQQKQKDSAKLKQLRAANDIVTFDSISDQKTTEMFVVCDPSPYSQSSGEQKLV